MGFGRYTDLDMMLPLSSCVTLDKSMNFSNPDFLTFKMKIIPVSLSGYEN